MQMHMRVHARTHTQSLSTYIENWELYTSSSNSNLILVFSLFLICNTFLWQESGSH